MNIKEFFEELKYKRVAILTFCFSAFICPGFLLVKLFWPSLLIQLDFSKLLIFSMSLSLPFTVCHLVLVNLLEIEGLELSDSESKYLEALVATTFIAHALIVVAYVFSMSFKSFVITTLCTEVALMVIAGITRKVDAVDDGPQSPT